MIDRGLTRRRVIVIVAAVLAVGTAGWFVYDRVAPDFSGATNLHHALSPGSHGQQFDGRGMLLGQFYDNLRRCRFYVETTTDYLKDQEWHFAMTHATKAITHFKIMRGTYDGLLVRMPEWGEAYAGELQGVRRFGETELPGLKGKMDEFAALKRELIMKLSDKWLVQAYIAPEASTLPDEGMTMDVLAEMRVRHRAARALLARIENPRHYHTYGEDDRKTPEQSVASDQVRWAIGYEVVLAEARWLMDRAPAGQLPECRRLLRDIEAGMPVMERLFEVIAKKQVDKRDPQYVFEGVIRRRRERFEARLAFPENVTVREDAPGGPDSDAPTDAGDADREGAGLGPGGQKGQKEHTLP